MLSINEFYHRRYANLKPGGVGPEGERTFRARIDMALQMIPGSAQHVLDFGCGLGAASKLLAAAGHRVVGDDISAPAIQHAQTAVPAGTFITIDSETHIPLPDASFDVCLCTEVIEHLFDVQGFLGETHRLLVHDGLLLVTAPYHGWVKNLFIVTFRFERHFNPMGGHIRFFSQRSLTQCLLASRFQVEATQGIGRMWPLWKTWFVKARKG
jgi:2-polyprenyl-3-methyl-5-hydroxy-6-metoxy-1,4-benzoquinol methylase